MAPLPGSRDIDAVDSGPLPAATVNNIQDAIISRAHGEIDQMVGLNAGRFQGVAPETANEAWWELDNNAGDKGRWILPFRPGDRVLEWQIYVQDFNPPPSLDRVNSTLYAYNANDGTRAAIGSPQTSDGTGTDQTLGEDLRAGPHVVVADFPIEIQIEATEANGNPTRIYPVIRLWWDHP